MSWFQSQKIIIIGQPDSFKRKSEWIQFIYSETITLEPKSNYLLDKLQQARYFSYTPLVLLLKVLNTLQFQGPYNLIGSLYIQVEFSKFKQMRLKVCGLYKFPLCVGGL